MKNWNEYDKLANLVWGAIRYVIFYVVMAIVFHCMQPFFPTSKLLVFMFWGCVVGAVFYTFAAIFMQVKIFKLEK